MAFASPLVPIRARSASVARYAAAAAPVTPIAARSTVPAGCGDLEVADPARGVRQRGELRANGLVVRDIAMGRKCADHDRPIGLGAYLVERGDAAEIHDRLGLCEPEFHERQQAVAAGDH